MAREKGPRRDVRIRIAYAGRTPGPLLASKREELERRLCADNAGTAVRNVAGDGAVNLTIVTADADRTREIAWKHVNDLGLTSRTTIFAEIAERRGRVAR